MTTQDNLYKLKVFVSCIHHNKCSLQVGIEVCRCNQSSMFNCRNFGQIIQRPKVFVGTEERIVPCCKTDIGGFWKSQRWTRSGRQGPVVWHVSRNGNYQLFERVTSSLTTTTIRIKHRNNKRTLWRVTSVHYVFRNNLWSVMGMLSWRWAQKAVISSNRQCPNHMTSRLIMMPKIARWWHVETRYQNWTDSGFEWR